jgi:membrane protein
MSEPSGAAGPVESDPQPHSSESDPVVPSAEEQPGSWRTTKHKSVLRDFWAGLNSVEFGDRIILFGAALLLSVLPLIILLNALASQRIDDDISQHLGLSSRGSKVIEGLFRHTTLTFNLGVLISIALSLAGTIAVARSVQIIYERAYDVAPARGARNLLRCIVWVAVTAAIFILDSVFGVSQEADRVRPEVIGLVTFLGFALFFWWGPHFLLGGRVPWRSVFPTAIVTSLFWVGLGVFASFYFSSTVISDSDTYGTVGVVFTLTTWFIAMGAVFVLGAVIGVMWLKRAPLQRRRARERDADRPR